MSQFVYKIDLEVEIIGPPPNRGKVSTEVSEATDRAVQAARRELNSTIGIQTMRTSYGNRLVEKQEKTNE